jgi:hypothetical protein
MSTFNSGFDEKRCSMSLGDKKVTDENGFLIALFLKTLLYVIYNSARVYKNAIIVACLDQPLIAPV